MYDLTKAYAKAVEANKEASEQQTATYKAILSNAQPRQEVATTSTHVEKPIEDFTGDELNDLLFG